MRDLFSRVDVRWRLESVRILLAAEAVLLLVSGCVDIVGYGTDLAFSALLPVGVGLVNAVAALDVTKELAKTANTKGTVRRRRPSEMATVIVAQASTVPVWLVPLWTESHSGVFDGSDKVICVVATVLLGVAIVVLVAAARGRPEVSLNKAWVVLLAVLPLASSAQFWYSTFYKPAHQRPNVNVVATLAGVGPPRAGVSRVKASVTLENTGSTDLDFFGAAYTVTRLGVPRADKPLTQKQLAGVVGPETVPANDTSGGYDGLVHAGGLVRAGGHIAPGQHLSTSVVFDMADATRSRLRLTVLLSTLVDNGEGLAAGRRCRAETAYPSTCWQTSVPTQGWLRGVLSDHPVARTTLASRPHKPPDLTTLFDLADAPESDFRPSTEVHEVNPYLNTRGFTTSVEYSTPGSGRP